MLRSSIDEATSLVDIKEEENEKERETEETTLQRIGSNKRYISHYIELLTFKNTKCNCGTWEFNNFLEFIGLHEQPFKQYDMVFIISRRIMFIDTFKNIHPKTYPIQCTSQWLWKSLMLLGQVVKPCEISKAIYLIDDLPQNELSELVAAVECNSRSIPDEALSFVHIISYDRSIRPFFNFRVYKK
jgi:hypothetical protein